MRKLEIMEFAAILLLVSLWSTVLFSGVAVAMHFLIG